MRAIDVELIPDGGLSVASEEFFRSPEFLEAERITHTLVISEGGYRLAAAPVVLRRVPGAQELYDASSPYGYPGFVGRVARLDTASMNWPARLVSVFIRDRLDYAPLSTARRRSKVRVANPKHPIRVRRDHRVQIVRNERLGFTSECLPGRATSPSQRRSFERVYRETMVRTGAERRYHYAPEYFDRILVARQSFLCSVFSPAGRLAAAAILVASDGWLHYFLSGTADEYLQYAPSKNVVMHLVSMSVQQGMPLNLGGGLEPGDGLDEFKNGFANEEADFRTSNTITNDPVYARLSRGVERGDYFPAYRVPDEEAEIAPSVSL